MDEEKTETEADNIALTSPLGKPHPIDIYLGRRISEIREEAEITQQDFANQLGITQSQLIKFEHGTDKIPASLLWYIAALLEEDLNVFFKDILPSSRYKIPKRMPIYLY